MKDHPSLTDKRINNLEQDIIWVICVIVGIVLAVSGCLLVYNLE